MARTLHQPIRGLCLNACWYGNTANGPCGSVACPKPLWCFLSNSNDHLAVEFMGRGKTGLSCPGADPFITLQGSSSLFVDVWAAYAAGLWTSSVPIAVYASVGASNPSSTVVLNVRVNVNPSTPCPNRGGIPLTTPIRGEACPSRQIALITVFDDGTYACVMQ